MKRFLKFFAAKKPTPATHRIRKNRFQFEHLEARQMMSAAPASATVAKSAFVGPIQTMPIATTPSAPPVPVSAGTIDLVTFGSAGIVTITGSDTAADTVKVTIDNRGTASTADDMVTVTMTNIGTPLVKQFALSKVTSISFSGQGGSDFFQNMTSISSTAYGGEGRDVLIGGSGADNLQGNNGDDFLDGASGDDVLWGGDGNDMLFGDAGKDTLHGGNNDDFLFGGADTDTLLGEDGNDLLQGGAGFDKLTGAAGIDKFFDSAAELATSDFTDRIDIKLTTANQNDWAWFDDNLSDPTVRSLARADYFRDIVLTRNDFMEIYSAVGKDGTVNANELADMRKLTDAHLSMADDVRNLAHKLASPTENGNFNYQGQWLGSLAAGSSADQLQKLENKWFLGLDRPETDHVYQHVSGSLFQNGVSYLDVAQGNLGDCYFMASLSSLSIHSPNDIVNMFHDNGDGTFTVRFFNQGVADYVTVDCFLPVNPATNHTVYAGVGGGAINQSTNELWAALAEKAFAQVCSEYWTRQDHNGANSYTTIEAGYPVNVYPLLTGHAAQEKQVTAEAQTSVLVALQLGQAVTLCTGNDELGNAPIATNIVPLHVYTIVGYDATTKTFLLANPWSYQDVQPQYPPFLALTWDQIAVNFAKWDSTTG